MEFVYLIYNIV